MLVLSHRHTQGSIYMRLLLNSALKDYGSSQSPLLGNNYYPVNDVELKIENVARKDWCSPRSSSCKVGH